MSQSCIILYLSMVSGQTYVSFLNQDICYKVTNQSF